jgi:hypothetical protein
MNRIRGAWAWLLVRLPWAGAFLGLVLACTVTTLQLSKKAGAADGTTLGLIALDLLLLFAVLAPAQVGRGLNRIANFKFAGVELGLTEIKRAERVRPVPGHDDGVEVERPSTSNSEDYHRQLVKQAKNRLQFCHDILCLRAFGIEQDDHRQTVEHLRRSRLLSRDEENFMLGILEERPLEGTEWSTRALNDVLGSAWDFVIRLGPEIWDRFVRGQLDEAGWFVANYDQSLGHRRDFLVCRNNKWALLTARVGGPNWKPEDLSVPLRRLAEFTRLAQLAGRRIVIPDIRHFQAETDAVSVIRLGALLETPSLAFDVSASISTVV